MLCSLFQGSKITINYQLDLVRFGYIRAILPSIVYLMVLRQEQHDPCLGVVTCYLFLGLPVRMCINRMHEILVPHVQHGRDITPNLQSAAFH